MNEIIEKLTSLQKQIHKQNGQRLTEFDSDKESLMFSVTEDDLLKIYFYGIDSRKIVMDFLSSQDVAQKLKYINFDSPDEGANGTNNFDFSALIENKEIFPNLKDFSVRLTQLEDHNQTIVGETYEEDGQIAQLINKMPNLLSLKIPSAPNSNFFKLENHPLQHLIVQTGFDSQNFILNFSESSCFSKLRYFDFTDFQDNSIENWKDECVPFEHFVKLFNSKAFNSIHLIVLRNVNLTNEQITELKSLQKNISFKLIKTSSNYI